MNNEIAACLCVISIILLSKVKPILSAFGKEDLNCLSAESIYAEKYPGVPYASKDTNSIAVKGEASAAAGLLGLGKLMTRCITNCSEITDLGDTCTDGKFSL